MWVGLHNNWHRVKTITRAAPWLAIVLLFFSSLVPYATRIVSAHFMRVGAQVFYGLIIIGVTLANLVLYRSVLGDAPRNRLLFWDVVVKCGALLLSFVFPPTMLIVTLLAAIFWVVMGLKSTSMPACKRRPLTSFCYRCAHTCLMTSQAPFAPTQNHQS